MRNVLEKPWRMPGAGHLLHELKLPASNIT